MLKRTFDILSSVIGVILLSPVFVAVAICIKREDSGPVFYRGRRIGLNGRPFRIFKFRTMVVDAEKIGGSSTGDDDPRITKVGKFLRKYKLDELPQLFNVLKGEMSIVGPRPERPVFVDELRKMYPFYQKRLTIKPGLTGWAQVKLEYDTDMESVANKLRYDFYYIENQSIFLDLEILARTLKVVLTGAGAH